MFTTATCINCRAAKKILDNAGVDYTTVDAADHQGQVARYGVKQAPTLIAVSSGNTQRQLKLIHAANHLHYSDIRGIL